MCSFGMYWRFDEEEILKEQIMEEILYKEVVVEEESSTFPEF